MPLACLLKPAAREEGDARRALGSLGIVQPSFHTQKGYAFLKNTRSLIFPKRDGNLFSVCIDPRARLHTQKRLECTAGRTELKKDFISDGVRGWGR